MNKEKKKIKIYHIFIRLNFNFSLIFFSVFTLFKYKDLIINLEIKGD